MKKSGFYLGLFQMPGFFKNVMVERKNAHIEVAVLHRIISIQIRPNCKIKFDEYTHLDLIRLPKRCSKEFLKGTEVLRHTKTFGIEDKKGLFRAKPRYSQKSTPV